MKYSVSIKHKVGPIETFWRFIYAMQLRNVDGQSFKCGKPKPELPILWAGGNQPQPKLKWIDRCNKYFHFYISVQFFPSTFRYCDIHLKCHGQPYSLAMPWTTLILLKQKRRKSGNAEQFPMKISTMWTYNALCRSWDCWPQSFTLLKKLNFYNKM